MKVVRYIFLGLYIFLTIFIFTKAAANAEESTNDSDKVTEVVIDVGNAVSKEDVVEKYGMDNIKTFVRKGIGHFGAFMALGVLGCLTYYLFINKKILRYIIMFAAGLLSAAISEIIQIFADGRGPGIGDVLLDYSGYVIGVGLCLLLIMIIILIKRRKTNAN